MIQANIVVDGRPARGDAAGRGGGRGDLQPLHGRAAARGRSRSGAPRPWLPFATPVSVDESALAAIPRSYVLTKQDRSIPPALQRRMIREHPCERVIELDADHAPYFSATDELVAALLELAS